MDKVKPDQYAAAIARLESITGRLLGALKEPDEVKRQRIIGQIEAEFRRFTTKV